MLATVEGQGSSQQLMLATDESQGSSQELMLATVVCSNYFLPGSAPVPHTAQGSGKGQGGGLFSEAVIYY